MIQPHEHHRVPAADTSLWRYMDFAKLVEILDDRQLFFVRSDLFDDPYEGQWSEAGMAVMNEGLPPGVQMARKTAGLDKRKGVFASCWHMSNFESAAMWQLYSQSSQAIAIQCRYGALAEALNCSDRGMYASKVFYSDYTKNPIALWQGGTFPFFNKRESFEHEKEFRVLISTYGMDREGRLLPDEQHAIGVPIDPAALFENIFVHPRAPKWFGALVRRVASRYQLKVPIVDSELYARPLR